MKIECRSFFRRPVSQWILLPQVLGTIAAGWWAAAVYLPEKKEMAAFREYNAKKYAH
jgi:hypothetical protein